MNKRQSLIAGGVLGALAVGTGAFGAHALKTALDMTGRTDTFELAIRYQFYHALALLLVGILQHFAQDNLLRFSGMSFLCGIILFSGSLYALCITGIKAFAMATPVGGLLLIAGWILLTVGVVRTAK